MDRGISAVSFFISFGECGVVRNVLSVGSTGVTVGLLVRSCGVSGKGSRLRTRRKSPVILPKICRRRGEAAPTAEGFHEV